MTKQVSLQNTLGGGFGLPTGQLVPGNGSIAVEPEIWDAVKDHPVVKARVDVGTLIVDGKGQKKPGTADENRDENGDTAEMAEMRKQFDASYSALTSELQVERSKVSELETKVADLEVRAASESSAGAPLKAVHRGGPSWSVVRGEAVEIVEKLTKEEAEIFNAATPDEQAKFVADRTKA